MRRVILGDDELDFAKLDPRQALRDAVLGANDPVETLPPVKEASPGGPVNVTKPANEPAPYDQDAT